MTSSPMSTAPGLPVLRFPRTSRPTARFTKLRDESQDDVKAIIEMAATGDFAKGSDEQKVGDMYKSYLDMESRNARRC